MTGRPPRRSADEDGVAVVWGVCAIALLVTVMFVCMYVAVLVAAHREAQASADLSALAGAGALRVGHDPCSSASVVARHNHGHLTRCTVSRLSVGIEVEVESRGPFGLRHLLRARAVAGPSGAG